MKTFWEFANLLEADALGSISSPGAMPGPAPGAGPAPSLGAPPGGGPPGMGGLPGMGGGMGGPMGGPPGMGMGGPPGMGNPGGATTPAIQMKPLNVWDVLERILKGKPLDDKKQSGQNKGNMLDSGQPQQMTGTNPDPMQQPPMQASNPIGDMGGPEPNMGGTGFPAMG